MSTRKRPRRDVGMSDTSARTAKMIGTSFFMLAYYFVMPQLSTRVRKSSMPPRGHGPLGPRRP